jgi:hypothetical protein
MYLFTRAGTFRPGAVRSATAFVGAVTEKVRQETGEDVHAYLATMSPEVGTCAWAVFVESLDELVAIDDKLAVSEDYLDLVEQAGELWAGPLQDSLGTVVHGAPDASGPLPGYVTVARARAANGRLADAMAGGVEIAEAATRIGGVPTMFVVDGTGPFGGCRWISGHADIGSVQRSEAALMADPAWPALIDRIGTAYENDASQAVYRRLV